MSNIEKIENAIPFTEIGSSLTLTRIAAFLYGVAFQYACDEFMHFDAESHTIEGDDDDYEASECIDGVAIDLKSEQGELKCRINNRIIEITW